MMYVLFFLFLHENKAIFTRLSNTYASYTFFLFLRRLCFVDLIFYTCNKNIKFSKNSETYIMKNFYVYFKNIYINIFIFLGKYHFF